MAPTQSKTADWLFVARRERHRLVIWQEDTKVTNSDTSQGIYHPEAIPVVLSVYMDRASVHQDGSHPLHPRG